MVKLVVAPLVVVDNEFFHTHLIKDNLFIVLMVLLPYYLLELCLGYVADELDHRLLALCLHLQNLSPCNLSRNILHHSRLFCFFLTILHLFEFSFN